MRSGLDHSACLLTPVCISRPATPRAIQLQNCMTKLFEYDSLLGIQSLLLDNVTGR